MPRSRCGRIAAALVSSATALLVLTGCNSTPSSDRKPADTTQSSTAQSALPSDSPEPSQSSRRLCDDAELASKYPDVFCNPSTATDNSTSDQTKVMAFKPGQAPLSTKLNGRVNVQSFLLNAMRSQRDMWRAYFAGTGFDVPSFSSDIVSGSEKFESNCPVDPISTDKRIVVKANSASALYCPAIEGGSDKIAFPADTVATVWEGHDRKTADMAAAIVAARAGGLILNRALARIQGGSLLDPYAASSCLAGVWARGAYPASDAGDLNSALAYAKTIMVKIGNGTDPEPKALDFAWLQGYKDGRASTCSDSAAWLSENLMP